MIITNLLELTPTTHSGNRLNNSWLLLSFQLSQLSLLTFLLITINVNDYLLLLQYVYFQKNPFIILILRTIVKQDIRRI